MNEIANFLYESGQIKRVKRSGWWLAGISDPESVADHSFRVIVIGYILAKLENADLSRVLSICLFHDIHETRLNDIHKVGQRYYKMAEAEDLAFLEQMNNLPDYISSPIKTAISDLKNCKSLEAKVANDADQLECLLQAREYQSQGFCVLDWITSCNNNLKTDSAKELAKSCLQIEPNDWWDKLKKL